MGNGEINNEYKKLSLLRDEIVNIPKRPFRWNKNLAHPHCITVRSADNINEILSDELQGIILRVSLKHGLTGLSDVFEQEYGNESDIKSGKFKPGTQFGFID